MTESTTHSRILDAAEKIIRMKGLDALSMRAISGEIGLSAPAAYRHFTGKDEILQAVIARGFGKFSLGLEKAREGLSEPEDLLSTSLRFYLRFWTRDAKGFEVLAARKEAKEVLRQAEIENSSFGDLPALVKRTLGEGFPGAEAANIARWVATSLYGATESLVMDEPRPAAEREKKIDSMANFLLCAVITAKRNFLEDGK
jgi:AcrR family transcriptional regulator